MSRLMVTYVVCVGLVGSAQADEFPYLPSQLQLEVHGEQAVSDVIDARATLVNFRVPGDDLSLYLFYGGVNFKLFDGALVLSPHVGFVPAWAEDGSDAWLASLWFTWFIDGGTYMLFLEADGYLSPDQNSYRGFYTFVYNAMNWLNVGAHCEHLDELVTFGPHVGFTVGDATKTNFHVNLELHTGVQDENQGYQTRLTTQVWWR